MLPKWHFILGLFPSLILYFFSFSPLEISIFFLSSFLFIDFDHVPRWVLKSKSINPIRFYKEQTNTKKKWFKLSRKQREAYKKPIFFFHNIETLVILALISFLFPLFWFVLSGFLFHLLCDLIYQHYKKEEKHYKISLIYTLVKNKGKKDFV